MPSDLGLHCLPESHKKDARYTDIPTGHTLLAINVQCIVMLCLMHYNMSCGIWKA